MTQQEEQILEWIREDPMISQQELASRAGIARSTVSVHISNLMKKGCISGRGYVVKDAPYAVVVGGVNIDIGGTPLKPLVAQDSNPGTVRVSLGGVGRNIAHDMALLGLDVRLITALGDDAYAQQIISSCLELGIDAGHSVRVAGGRTSTYLFISDEQGDMQLAIADMQIYDHLTPQYLAGKAQLLNNARLVIVDTNIPAASIAWIAQNCRAPIFMDTVSTAKAVKALPVLGRLHTLKPNRLEAEILSGVRITDSESLKKCADVLLETGLERVFISLGAEGVYAAEKGRSVKLGCIPGEMVNTTGCGDAFMAALAWSSFMGLDLEESAAAGLAASAIAMESDQTINPLLCREALALRAGLDIEKEEAMSYTL